MNTKPNYPDFPRLLAAVQHRAPDLPLDHAETIAVLLCEGDCGLVVLLWDRELCKKLLDHIKDPDCWLELSLATKYCFSIVDKQGYESSDSFRTPALLAELGLTPEPTPPLPPPPLLSEVLDAFNKTYHGHYQSLPKGHNSYTPNMDFSSFAAVLAGGDAGASVYTLGREFVQHLIPNIEEVGAYELLPILRRAVEAGESQWDSKGHLEVGHEETTLPDSYSRGMPMFDEVDLAALGLTSPGA